MTGSIFLHELEINSKRSFLHIDFQLEHDNECQRRFFVYNAMLTELKKPIPVITLPVYIRPRVKALPDSYEVMVGELVAHKFTYQPIQLWDYVEQIWRGELYIFAPLLPVLIKPPTEALLEDERALILRHESNPDRQRTLLTTAILVAAQSKLFNADLLWALFKEDPMDLDNPVIAKLFDRAYGKQLAEEVQKEREKITLQMDALVMAANRRALLAETEATRREAEAEAALRQAEAETAQQWQATALKILEHRFTSVPIALVLLLQAVTPTQRNMVTDVLLDAPTAEACLQALRELLGVQNGTHAK